MSDSAENANRLAYLTTAYPNVSHTFIRREIRELERRGHDVVRVAIRKGEAVVDPDDLDENEKTLHLLGKSAVWLISRIAAGLVVANVRLFGAVAAAWRLNRASDRSALRHGAYLLEGLALTSYLRDHSVGHVHVHFGTNAAAVAMLVKLLGGPTYSMTIHGPDEFDAAIGFSLGEKMRAALFTIAISNYCASQLRRWVPYEEWGKIHIVHCTVGNEWAAACHPIDSDSESIVCIGRLSAQKGQLLLIDAVAAAVEQGFQDQVILVGDGEMRSVIEARIATHGLADKVRVTGWCTGADVRKLLLSAKALVLPSFAEGLPVVIMESMALQRPVLSTFVAGIPELIVDGEHGWLIAAGDHDALVEKLLRVQEAPIDLLRSMGSACGERVIQNHSIETEVAKLEYMFQSIAGITNASAQRDRRK